MIIKRCPTLTRRSTKCTVCQDNTPAVQIRLSGSIIVNLCVPCWRNLAWIVMTWDGCSVHSSSSRPIGNTAGAADVEEILEER
jgi:hypothetical protein